MFQLLTLVGGSCWTLAIEGRPMLSNSMLKGIQVCVNFVF